MKTLAELIGESLDMQDTHGEQVAGLVGAVQEWVGQGGLMRDELGLDEVDQLALIREAGKGLGEDVAAP